MPTGRLIAPDWFTVSENFAAADVIATVAAKLLFVCPAGRQCKVLGVSEVHAVVATQAGTADVEKLTGTQAVGGAAGVVVLGTTKINLAGTVNVVQEPALSSTASSLLLAAGDRLALKLATGAATTLANARITILMEWLE